MRIAIIIPTLGGSGLVLAIKTLSTRIPSRVRMGSDYQPLPGLSKRYMSLTADGGPLSGFLEEGVNHDLEIDLEPETGRSWELPVALAHWLLFQGHQIVTENPDVIIWSTGALQANGNILSDSYHVKDKLAESSDRISKLGDARLIFLLPDGQNMSDARASFGKANILEVTSLKSAFSALKDLENRPVREAGRRLRWGKWLAGGVAGLALLAAFLYLQELPAPAVQPVERAASEPSPAPAPSMPANRVQIEHHTNYTKAGYGRVYTADLVNPGPESVRVTYLRIANADGDGLLADGGFILQAGGRQALVFKLGNTHEDREAAIICLSGETGDIAWHEKSLYQSGKMTDHDMRTGDPYPECNNMDFTWLEFSSRPECLKVQERLGALAASDCSGLQEEAPEEGMRLMPWGTRSELREAIDSAPKRGARETEEDVQTCTARVIEEHFENESAFAEEAADWASLLGKPTWSERDQLVFLGGNLMSMGQGGHGVLERSAEKYCLEGR